MRQTLEAIEGSDVREVGKLQAHAHKKYPLFDFTIWKK